MQSRAMLLSAGVGDVVALVIGFALSLLALRNQNFSGQFAYEHAVGCPGPMPFGLASYNYRDLDHDFSAVAAKFHSFLPSHVCRSTTPWATQPPLSQYKATAVADVVSAGVVSASTSRAVVLVFLDQKVAHSTRPRRRQIAARSIFRGQMGALAGRQGQCAVAGPRPIQVTINVLLAQVWVCPHTVDAGNRAEPARPAPEK